MLTERDVPWAAVFVQRLVAVATGHTSEEYIFKRAQSHNFISPMHIGKLGLHLDAELGSLKVFWDPHTQWLYMHSCPTECCAYVKAWPLWPFWHV